MTNLLLLVLLGGCVSYQPYERPRGESGTTPPARLQVLLDDAVNEFQLPGIQAGLLPHGQAPVLAASGTEDWERRGAVINLHSSFRVGSTTKMFVAALICRLVEQKRLDWDDRLAQWFPEYPQAHTITVRQLLNQTSGIQESLFTDGSILVVSVVDTKKRWNPTEVMKTLAKKSRPAPETDRHFVYANDNYILLGLIAERVTDKTLANLLESEFFIPLGMRDTCLLPGTPRPSVGPVPGYDEFIPLGPHRIGAEQTSWDSLTFAAGAMASSAADLLVWLDALFHGRVVSEASLEIMRIWVSARDNGRDNSIVGYGLGIAQYSLEGVVLEGHPGGGFGGECFPFYDSVEDTSYVVVYNLSRKDNPAGKAILRRMMALLPQDGSPRKPE